MQTERQTASTAPQRPQSTGNSIRRIFEAQRGARARIALTDAAARIEKIRRLRKAIESRASDLKKAIYDDYRKSGAEVDITEVYPSLMEADFTIKNLHEWMQPTHVPTPLAMMGASSEIRYEPKGVTLIIGPWNYPFSLVINPLISSIAAGNTVIAKPSELTPRTSAFLGDLLAGLFEESEVAVVQGDATASQELLALPFDHIFFTGSTRVGKVVAEAAAKYLTPVTLELGGKSPAIVDESADLRITARRTLWGKCVNSGQTCVAPDYLMIPEARLGEFVAEARAHLTASYGSRPEDWERSEDLCRIINDRNFERVRSLTERSVSQGAKVELGGVFKPESRYISPTLLSAVTPAMPIMSEEIFGPVLPILTYRRLEEAYEVVRSMEKPLALYVFSRDSRRTEEILRNTTAGGTCVNNTIVHLGNHHLPFGGVGPSGVGSYHGYFGFKTFSHERAVLRQGRLNPVEFMYPPYRGRVLKMIKMALRFLT